MYLSKTMGNVVETRKEVIIQIWDSLIHYRTLDIQWCKAWHDGNRWHYSKWGKEISL